MAYPHKWSTISYRLFRDYNEIISITGRPHPMLFRLSLAFRPCDLVQPLCTVLLVYFAERNQNICASVAEKYSLDHYNGFWSSMGEIFGSVTSTQSSFSFSFSLPRSVFNSK